MITSAVVTELQEHLRMRVDVTALEDESLIREIEKEVSSDPRYQKVSLNERSALINGTYAAIRGYDVLEEWMRDPEVTEIMVNRYDQIYIEKDGILYHASHGFSSVEKYNDIIQKIVNDSGKEVHQRNPIVDCRMKDGSRVNVVLDPISKDGAALTIRRFRSHIFTLEELVSNGTLSMEVAYFLKECVQARLNIFISGGTGSGKTTLLNALANEISPTERLITVEDARELNFENMENWIALEARRANAMGEGEITIRDLIRACLRMRPDRIIVGEVRGTEALDAIQAMNTGHDGSFSTGHANSVPDMQLRLETMILSGNDGIPLEAIRQQISSAIDLFVHVGRFRDHRRYVMAVEEPFWGENRLCYNTIYAREITTDGLGALVGNGARMKNRDKFVRAGIDLDKDNELTNKRKNFSSQATKNAMSQLSDLTDLQNTIRKSLAGSKFVVG